MPRLLLQELDELDLLDDDTLDTPRGSGATPLHTAVSSGAQDSAALLLKWGANKDIREGGGNSISTRKKCIKVGSMCND